LPGRVQNILKYENGDQKPFKKQGKTEKPYE
jgi:hypothetical protein